MENVPRSLGVFDIKNKKMTDSSTEAEKETEYKKERGWLIDSSGHNLGATHG